MDLERKIELSEKRITINTQFLEDNKDKFGEIAQGILTRVIEEEKRSLGIMKAMLVKEIKNESVEKTISRFSKI